MVIEFKNIVICTEKIATSSIEAAILYSMLLLFIEN
jgi:hypothetical protein